YLGEYRVFAKVNTTAFHNATEEAKRVAKTGAQYKTDFDAAKAEWKGKYDEGRALVGTPEDRGMWPAFLKTLSEYLPDPTKPPYNLNPSNPMDVPRIERLRVHIDAIKPVWRGGVAADWFGDETKVKRESKNFMHPYDRANAPSGPGWIVQLVAHHYNPSPEGDEARLPEGKRTAYGPYQYLTSKIIPALNNPRLRMKGVHHVALSW